jgi:hypothetical protein
MTTAHDFLFFNDYLTYFYVLMRIGDNTATSYRLFSLLLNQVRLRAANNLNFKLCLSGEAIYKLRFAIETSFDKTLAVHVSLSVMRVNVHRRSS